MDLNLLEKKSFGEIVFSKELPVLLKKSIF